MLVWWQDDWALPIDGTVLEQVARYAWRDVAYGWAD
jgi:hypothetical protein